MVERHDWYLLPEERLLWQGRPARGIIFQAADIFLIPFSLIWTGGVLSFNVGSLISDGFSGFNLFVFVFLLVGLYITVGRFAVDAWLRSRLRYAVTNRRILIRSLASTQSLDIGNLPSLELDERRDGRGSIRFAPGGEWWMRGDLGSWSPAMDRTPQFIRIERVRDVYVVIEKQMVALRLG